jgi:type II secretory pathway pseudopilin PulG
LVVVILVIGVLAAIIVPRLMSQSVKAEEAALREDLRVVRNAIQFYRAQNGSLPGASDGRQRTFKLDLAPYLNGPFPVGPLGPVKGSDQVILTGSGSPLVAGPPLARAWRYDYRTGEFIYNFNGVSSDGVTLYSEF